MQGIKWGMCAAIVVSAVGGPVVAAELKLADQGKTEYQIVVPDIAPSVGISNGWWQAARLVQAAFKAGGAEAPIVREREKDAARPGLYVGATAFARAKGVDLAGLTGWGYVQKVVGRDVILAGHDQPALPGSAGPAWDRLGTVKGVADFLRTYAGARFLYPAAGAYENVDAFASANLLDSPSLEFLPTSVITIPSDLSVCKTPLLAFNIQFPPGSGFYNIANNRFPLVDTVFGCHTYWRAVPGEKYFSTHPEYFALVNGKRVNGGQYCISNPGFQECLYRDMIGFLDKGYGTVDLGQPDGFQPCQCAECNKLYSTGSDWSEKLWILHRTLAERVLQSHPGKRVTLMAYMATETPPKTFRKFPKNVNIMLCGTNEEDIEPWLAYEVPSGFTAYIYNWCPNLGTRYTPMRTPLFVETQARRFAKLGVQGINRDGGGQLFGLEGPVYYVMGRMFDDPATNQAKDLMHEFCGAAFGKAAGPMLRFYDQLYHGIELYSDYLGTRAPAWAYRDIKGGGRKYLGEPFQLISFLYTPSLLASLEKELAQAEALAENNRVSTRLKLVRREFDYVNHLARVVHLYQGYQTQPTLDARDRVLDAIDARNAAIARYYDPKTRSAAGMGWVSSLFPYPGHSLEHLRLAYDGYQEPLKNSCLNWDTKAMRKAPLPGTKRMTVKPVAEAVGLDSPQWARAMPARLVGASPVGTEGGPGTATVKALYDRENLYVRLECELSGREADYPVVGRDGALDKQESLDLMLAPLGNREKLYRFMAGPRADSKYDAALGFITDVMDPRHNQADPVWNGEWTYETRLDPVMRRWVALVRIPYKTLGVQAPEAGAVWQGNFGRVHLVPNGPAERSVWSKPAGAGEGMDRDALGEMAFEAGIVHANVCVARKGQTPVFPYATWATAASNIQDAVKAASDSPLVLVEAGTYDLEREIVITNGITLKGVQGPGQTVVRGPYPKVGGRCLSVSHPGAVVEGLTIRNGCVAGNGGGVYLNAGTLRHCRVVGNAVTNGSGGGVFAVSGESLIEDCDIIGNSVISSAGNGAGVYLKSAARLLNSRVLQNSVRVVPHNAYGAGVFMEGAGANGTPTVTGCEISSNTLAGTPGGYGGGGVRMTGPCILRNCLVKGNSGPNGSAISITGSGAATVVENCTVVGNDIHFPYAGGSKDVHGQVWNVISDQAPGFAFTPMNGAFFNCCFPSTNTLIGTGNIAGASRFVDAMGGNFRLAVTSPGINSGAHRSWMEAATDLDGRPRIQGGTVDRGCYEFTPERR